MSLEQTIHQVGRNRADEGIEERINLQLQNPALVEIDFVEEIFGYKGGVREVAEKVVERLRKETNQKVYLSLPWNGEEVVFGHDENEDNLSFLVSYPLINKEGRRIASLFFEGDLTQETPIKRYFSLITLALNNALIYEKALRESQHDGLTGLYNRTHSYSLFEHEIKEAQRNPDYKGLAILMIDLDDFKRINDCYGHLEGDRALRKVTEIIKGKIRESDIAGRFGGEEFIIGLVNCDRENALKKAEGIRESVEKKTKKGDFKRGLTASIGVYYLSPEEIRNYNLKWSNIEEVIKKADVLAYQAKSQGKNQVCYG